LRIVALPGLILCASSSRPMTGRPGGSLSWISFPCGNGRRAQDLVDGSSVTKSLGAGTMITASRCPRDYDDPALSGAMRPVRPGFEAELRLHRSGYLALRGISCDVLAATARLQGQLSSDYLRQIAQEIALEIEGDREALNQTEIVVPSGRAPSGHDPASVATDRSVRTGRQPQSWRAELLQTPRMES